MKHNKQKKKRLVIFPYFGLAIDYKISSLKILDNQNRGNRTHVKQITGSQVI